MSADEHLSVFGVVTGSMIENHARHIRSDGAAPHQDGVVLVQVTAWQTMAEFEKMMEEIQNLIANHTGNDEGPGRGSRSLNIIGSPRAT